MRTISAGKVNLGAFRTYPKVINFVTTINQLTIILANVGTLYER